MESLRDITKALEDAPSLGDSHESICDAISIAIIIVNDKGQIVLVNSEAEFLTFYHRSELKGANVEVLVPEPKRDIHASSHRAQYMEHPHRREMGHGMDLALRRKDGTEISVEIQLGPVIWPQGRFTITAIRNKGAKEKT